ncbi:MAG: 50S ribosome-binding GTPase [Candidatus Omnitrophica bacterium]|nr:50S ribosome-binding GTPase [Candidatus Omnitrophota bacterium]
MLRDNVIITIKSGTGGNGSESVIKLTKIKRVPEGGDGGKGGDVVFIADNNVADLQAFMFNNLFVAENGGAGSSNKKTGAHGKDLILRVPCGTTITNADTGLCIRKLDQTGDSVIAAKGGDGGFGNVHKRNLRQGFPGEELRVQLNFVLPVDVCIIGFPNTGKSRLLATLTNSKVKVTGHPFSTQQPALGTLTFDDYKSLVLCELPSIISGSSTGKGIGSKFMKHLTHAPVVLCLLDPTSRFSSGVDVEYKTLRDELSACGHALSDKKVMIVINKIDAYNKDLLKDKIERFKNLYPTYLISLETGEGVEKMKAGIRKLASEE